jgi:hypothetical protein
MIAKEYIIGIYRKRPKTFVEELYFYCGFNMVKSATKNRTLSLPRNQGSKPK